MKRKLPLILLTLILLLAAFLRLYRISDYMTFLGDEGRDVLVAKDMLQGHLTLLGPRSSAGDFFMGPAYYYMITPFLWLFQLDPVGPAVMVALFGIATVFLIYYVGKKFFNEKAGLFAAALYTVSPLVINYSHSSWNPNVLPFFSLFTIYILYKAVHTKSWKYFVFGGFLLGIALQLHYLALFLCVITFVYIFCHSWPQTRPSALRYQSLKLEENPISFASRSWIPAFARMTRKVSWKLLLKQYVQIIGGFLIGFAPFLAFEVRHGFLNTKAIFSFIFGGQKGTDVHNTPFFTIVGDVFFRIFAKLVFFFPPPERYYMFNSLVLQISTILIVVVAIWGIIRILQIKDTAAKLLLMLWLCLGVLLFGLYKKSIFDYHFAFLFPLPFLIVGNLLSSIYDSKKRHALMMFLSILIFAIIFLYNLNGMPFRYQPNKQRDQVKTISEFVISKTNNKPFNFALITGGNSDHAYRYYLDILGHKAVDMDNIMNDPQRKTVTDQLMIVCEDTNCKPLGYSQFEVAGFGRAEISGSWNVSVVKVYRLVHYKGK